MNNQKRTKMYMCITCKEHVLNRERKKHLEQVHKVPLEWMTRGDFYYSFMPLD